MLENRKELHHMNIF